MIGQCRAAVANTPESTSADIETLLSYCSARWLSVELVVVVIASVQPTLCSTIVLSGTWKRPSTVSRSWSYFSICEQTAYSEGMPPPHGATRGATGSVRSGLGGAAV